MLLSQNNTDPDAMLIVWNKKLIIGVISTAHCKNELCITGAIDFIVRPVVNITENEIDI